MNAHFPIPAVVTATPAWFAALCAARAQLCIDGALWLHEAVDELEAYAKLSGLIDRIGQDEVQDIMGTAFAVVDLLPDDDLDEAYEREIFLGTAEIVRRLELADSRDRWRHTGEAPPSPDDIPLAPRPQPRTPQATVDAFFYVLRNERGRLASWLAAHPSDADHLHKLWKAKRCS